jgi:hypothetical protein
LGHLNNLQVSSSGGISQRWAGTESNRRETLKRGKLLILQRPKNPKILQKPIWRYNEVHEQSRNSSLLASTWQQDSRDQGQRGHEMLLGLSVHFEEEVGLGQISEIFDGYPPHHPRGMFSTGLECGGDSARALRGRVSGENNAKAGSRDRRIGRVCKEAQMLRLSEQIRFYASNKRLFNCGAIGCFRSSKLRKSNVSNSRSMAGLPQTQARRQDRSFHWIFSLKTVP